MSQSLIFIPLTYADQLALPTGDLIAPQITHEPMEKNIKAGSSQQFKASITDNVGVKTVTLFYRTTGSESYKRIKMDQVEDTTVYIATLGFEEIVEPGIEYYIQAVDLAGNALLHGYSFSPLKVGILPSETATAIAQGETVPASSEQEPKDAPLGKKKKTNKWLWIGLGVLAVGVIAAVAGGSDDDSGEPAATPDPQTGNVTFSGPLPGN